MPDRRNIEHDIKVMENEKDKTLEIEGENPEHAPQPGRKTPQKDEIDEDAINESGEPIYDDGKDENDAK